MIIGGHRRRKLWRQYPISNIGCSIPSQLAGHGCLVIALLSRCFPVVDFLSRLCCHVCIITTYCHNCFVSYFLSWLLCDGFHLLAFMSPPSCHGCPDIAVLSWLSCHSYPFMAVLKHATWITGTMISQR
jgi:hypothetical protein